MVNFAALCILEERIAKGLPIQDKNVAHFTSGMFSGMAAAFFSYPFTSFKDYALVQSTVKDGRLQNANTIKLTQELFYCFISNPGASLKSFGAMALKQVPIRMGLTGVIFALVAGVGQTMGEEPLKKLFQKDINPLHQENPSTVCLGANKQLLVLKRFQAMKKHILQVLHQHKAKSLSVEH